MIELQDDDIVLTTVQTRMLCEMLNNESLITPYVLSRIVTNDSLVLIAILGVISPRTSPVAIATPRLFAIASLVEFLKREATFTLATPLHTNYFHDVAQFKSAPIRSRTGQPAFAGPALDPLVETDGRY